jgi:nicotinamidase-related amidase
VKKEALGRHRSRVAVLLVDVVNRFDFDGAGALVRRFRPAVERIATLRTRARAARVPVVYANDNFGAWRSDFRAIIRSCHAPGSRAPDLVDRLAPSDDDYFVLKPANSAFFHTALESLLDHFGARELVIAGVAADNCVLFTAHDAYLRGYDLHVPRDCVAAESAPRTTRALAIIETTFKASIAPSRAIRFR